MARSRRSQAPAAFRSGGAYDGDGAAATKAHLNFPEGITFDRNGILFISDTDNHVIRKVAADGTISTYAGTGGQPGFSGDGGQAASAKLNYPKNIIFDASNNLYIADAYNHSVRKVTPGGLITTFAGNQRYAFSGDGGPATQASMEYPQSVVFDATGNAFVLEENGQRIRRVTPGGIISSVAGTGVAGFSGDGGPSLAATMRYPFGSMAWMQAARSSLPTRPTIVSDRSLWGKPRRPPSARPRHP